MNILSRDQQIQIIAALSEGMSIRATERLTGVHRDTVMRLGARVGAGCAALHDRTMHSLRVGRLELDEIWGYVGCKQKNVNRKDLAVTGDQYTFIALASTARAIITYRTGKRDSANTHEFAHDLRERVLGAPEISTDGFLPYQNAIRSAFGNRVAHGQIVKTYSVTNLGKSAAVRYSPAQVVAVSREVISGVPAEISTRTVPGLREKLVKIGAKVVRHGRYVIFQMAEVAVPKELFLEILRLIAELRPQPPPAPA
jgi:IS1 family transposase